MLYTLIRLLYLIPLLSGFFLLKLCGARPDIARLLRRLGPSFVKLGQTLSVRPDIVGHAYAARLAQLQDSMPPFSGKKAQHMIESALHAPIRELFLTFDRVPVAAASIAQVHRARTHAGEDVAVKVLRPGIARAFRRDIRLFYILARLIACVPGLRRLRPKEVVDHFADIIRKELDLRLEAASASEFATYMAHDAGIHVPKVYWPYTTQIILVTEWVHGVPIHDMTALQEKKHHLPNLAKQMYLHFLNQAYRDGFFHADIHPGNVFVRDDGIIVPVDFGIMGRLDEQTRLYVAEILRGFLMADYAHVADIHFKAGYVPGDQDRGDFMLALRAIGEPIFNCPASEISVARLLTLLFKVTRDFNMHTQPQLLLLQKTMILIEGVCKQLDPDINLWEVAKPWVEVWAKKNLGLRAQVRRKAGLVAETLAILPLRIQQLTTSLEKNTSPSPVLSSTQMAIWWLLGSLVLWVVCTH